MGPQLLHSSITSALDSLVDRLNQRYPPPSNNHNNNSPQQILALLVGTSDGIGLARSFGSPTSTSQQKRTTEMSEEILSSIETVWSTLPSDSNQGAGHHLRPLKMGGVRTVTAFYENVTLVHVHISPLVVSFVASPSANIGAIRANLPDLCKALEPIRLALEASHARGGNGTEQQQQQQRGGRGRGRGGGLAYTGMQR
mmetsp:Transcript_24158/g.35305  ORF Transcript_24158/g.35305 Transcript_24158/m.35305 type:complete len:198 (-) Transcript_24158:333-926(-)